MSCRFGHSLIDWQWIINRIVIVPNARLRGCKIEILSKSSSKGLMRVAEFQLAYGTSGERVDALFEKIWLEACASEKRINDERPAVAQVACTGDHGVTWRLCYWVKNSYGILDAAYAINRAAYDVAAREDIGLNTPLTHHIAVGANNVTAQHGEPTT